MRISRRYFVLFFILLFFLFGCFQKTNKKYSETGMVLGTYVRVDVCRSDQSRGYVSEALGDVWQRFEEIEQRMSVYDPESDIGRINAAQGDAVDVHKDVYSVIARAVHLSNKTGGAFDITVKPLIELWREAERRGFLPTGQEIRKAKQRLGVDRIGFPGRKGDFKIVCDGCQIDLGGIAKGYAIDEAVRILRAREFENFLIDAGGDMFANGQNCEGRAWRIGVRHPRVPDQLIDVFEISDQAVTTSGDYEQFYEIEGKAFSHIIDPTTGYPQEGNMSATVVAPTAMEADVFSTALMIWDPDKGNDFIDKQGLSYASYVLAEDGEGRLRRYRSSTYQQIKSRQMLDVTHISK